MALRARKVSGAFEKRVPGPETKTEFLEDKKATLTNSGKGSCILVPRLFLLVFPSSHERWRRLYKCTLSEVQQEKRDY